MPNEAGHNLTLITGGAKSGKTAYAEKLALALGGPVVYLATMPRIAGDAEQDEKILRHRQRRPKTWRTIESETEIHKEVEKLPMGDSVCIIDCLSLYVSNLFFQFEHRGGALRDQPVLSKRPPHAHGAASRFDWLEESIIDSINALVSTMAKQSQKTFFVITNEVGLGIVPDNEMARRYRDFLGASNQLVANSAAHVWLTCAGIPLKIK